MSFYGTPQKATVPDNDTAQYTCELSVMMDAPKDLAHFVKMKHGTSIPIAWPQDWLFTFWDLGRDTETEGLGHRLLRERYLCCDSFLFEIGIVHPKGSEPGRCDLIILIGEGGRVYLYCETADDLHMISGRNFVDFYQNGLLNYHPLRETFSEENLVEDVGILDLMKADNMSDLICARDRHSGREVFKYRDGPACCNLTICDPVLAGHGHSDTSEWAKEAFANRVEVLMVHGRWIDQKWITVPIIVSDTGKLFAVDPDTNRVQFIASSLTAFMNIGMMRFNNLYRYYKNCYSHGEMSRTEGRGIGRAFRPTSCSRGLFCKKKGEYSGGSLSRYYRSFKKACGMKQ